MRGLSLKVKQNINSLSKNIAKQIEETVDSKFMREIGLETIRLIQTRTRLGYGVTRQGGSRSKLKPLSSFYVTMRSNLKKSGALDSTTSPKKSNLTLTGQLLRSIQIKRASTGIAWVAPMGYRNDGLTNEEVANRVSKDRPFMFLSDLELKKVKRFALNNFQSIFKQRFK